MLRIGGVRYFSTKRICSNNLSLVEWGKYLPSMVGEGRLTKQESNMIKIPPYQFSVIIGLLLSDGWLIVPGVDRRNARLGFSQSFSRSAYVWFVFDILSFYCNHCPSLRKRSRSSIPFYSFEFHSRVLSCFTELHSLFYPQGVKVVPDNIYDLLTPVALAHLIMGDGAVSRHGLILCTNSYSVLDVVKLINVLMIRYNLECSIHLKRQNKKIEYMIYIKEGSMSQLKSIVSPYMHKSMLYKL